MKQATQTNAETEPRPLGSGSVLVCKLLLLALAASICSGQSTLGPPQVGYVRDEGGFYRAVWGIAGNFHLGEVVLYDVLGAAFSGRFGLLKTEDQVLVVDALASVVGRVEAGPGRAWFAFAGDGSPALALVPSSGSFFGWRDGRMERVPFRLEPGEEVLALGSAVEDRYRLAVRREGSCWMRTVSFPGGLVVDEMLQDDCGEPILLRHDGALISVRDRDVVLRSAEGVELHARLPDRLTRLEQMGADWIFAVTASGLPLALRLEPDRIAWFYLPQQVEEKR